MRYATWYVIVAGVAWIRRSWVETAEGGFDDRTWAVTFGDGPPVVRRGPPMSVRCGQIDDFAWDIDWVELAPPFEAPHWALRSVAPTKMTTHPALAVSGRIGDVVIDGAPGHTAQLVGKRHAQTWGWAHASSVDGRWLHLLTATAHRLPRLSQHASEQGGPGLPFARAAVGESDVRVGPWAASAPPESFIGLRYLDTDGSTVWCYHSEAATVGDFGGAAMEIAVREPIPGWAVEP